ncbi:MAG: DegT/DnrJ/EryC1/StrS family aminotransferase [Chthoniobacterales bacterium]
MRVPLLDLTEQYRALAEAIGAELDEIFATQRFILGPKLERFEQALSRYLGSPHAIGVSSGTDALLATLMAMEIGSGDAVLTTAFSFFATAGCIARVGARPVFIDIDGATCNLSPAALRSYIDNHCRQSGGKLLAPTGETIRAIVPVHLFGLACEMDKIMSIAREHRLLVIEDAAQSIGAEYPSSAGVAKTGTTGDAGCFSFYPSKNLGAAGDAGAVVCRSDGLAKRLRTCRDHGMEPRYHHEFIGGNFRLDEIQAAILKIKLTFLEDWAKARRAAADFYGGEFARSDLMGRVALPAGPYRDRGLANHHVYYVYAIRTSQRDGLREHLARREIETAIYYPLGLHEQKCFAYLGYKNGDLPETERAAREILALPIYPEISRDAQAYVVKAIVDFFR